MININTTEKFEQLRNEADDNTTESKILSLKLNRF